MNSEPLIQRRLRQSKLSFKQLSVDLNDNDCGKETNSCDIDNVDLVCKFCDPCASGRCSFPLSEQLIAHCRESHPTACLGCLEMFASSSDLLEHMEAFPHESPVCRDFYRSFGSVVAKVKEECMTGFSPSKSSFLNENPNGESSDSMEPGFHEEVNVKNGVKNVSCQFLCEFCTFDGCMNRKFKSRNGLFIHCLSCHPNGCLGCFELFDDSEVLLQHLEAFPHEPPVCRACCRSFGSIEAKSKHKCVASSRSSSNRSKAKTFYNTQPQLTFQSQSKRKRTSNDPKEVLVDDSLKLNANEADSNENFVLERMSTSEEDYDSDESLYSSSELLSQDAVSGWKNAAVNCLHCSFVARRIRTVPSIHVLRNHTCAHHPNVCLVCFESFDNYVSLAEHLKLLGHNMFCCKPCGKAFPSKRSYDQHERKAHEDHFPIRCSECSFGTFKTVAMRSHMRRMHCRKDSEVADNDAEKEADEQLPRGICPLCDFRSMSEFAVLMHMYDKHPEKNQVPKYKCEECQLAFGRPNSYAAHLRNKHWGDPRFRLMYHELKKSFITTFECEPCLLIFSDFHGFRRHLFMVHRSSTPYECSNCCLGFWDLFDLKEHNHKCHENSSPYACESCNLSFVDLDRLVLHLYQVHQRETLPYAYCWRHKVVLHGRRHYTKHMYLQHYLKSKPMEFPCEHCGKVLSSKKRLREHMNAHLPDRPFKCDECGKEFPNQVNLTNHVQMHSTRHQCPVCSKTFHSQPLLKRHAVVHTGEKPFECSICGLRVSQNSALKRHMDKVHPGGIMGKARSTKPRKCRVLSKTLESAVSNSKKTAEKPVNGASSTECELLKPQVRKSNELNAEADANQLKEDLDQKSKKRRRSVIDSSNSDEERREPVNLRPRKKMKVQIRQELRKSMEETSEEEESSGDDSDYEDET